MPALRLFIAFDTPPDIKVRMVAVRDTLKATGADVRWEAADKLHATLKFMGDTDEKLLPEIVYTIEGVCKLQSPLHVKYSGLGYFPNRRDPRVLWVGIEDLSGNLNSLQRAIEASLVPLGFEAEQRRFHAHVTLGRVKGERNIGSLLTTMESTTFESQPASIADMLLVKSELRPAGSVYTTLKTFPLNG